MIILKIGGSVIQKTLLDINPKIQDLLKIIQKSDEKVGIVNGGGPLSRLLQRTLRENGIEDRSKVDKMGYLTDNLFGHFLIMNLPSDQTYQNILTHNEILEKGKEAFSIYKYIVGGAAEIGHSSDFNAVQMAINFNSKCIIRITDVDFVYDKDPDTNPDARKIEKMDWEMYLNLINNKFESGGNYPFDPIASRLALENRVCVYLCSLENFLEKGSINFDNFVGTIIGWYEIKRLYL